MTLGNRLISLSSSFLTRKGTGRWGGGRTGRKGAGLWHRVRVAPGKQGLESGEQNGPQAVLRTFRAPGFEGIWAHTLAGPSGAAAFPSAGPKWARRTGRTSAPSAVSPS